MDDETVAGGWHLGYGTEGLEEEAKDGGWEAHPSFPDLQTRKDGCARLPARVGGRTQALLLFKAEKEGLIRLTINPSLPELEDAVLNKFLSMSGVAARMSDRTGATLNPWDAQRVQIVEHAVRRVLVPKLTAELRAHLRKQACDTVTQEYARALRRRVLLRPLPAIGATGFDRTRKGNVPAVVAVGCSDESRLADFAVAIEADGTVRPFWFGCWFGCGFGVVSGACCCRAPLRSDSTLLVVCVCVACVCVCLCGCCDRACCVRFVSFLCRCRTWCRSHKPGTKRP